MDVLKTQDEAYTHKNFQRAARGVLSIFLHLLDSPEDIDGLGHLPPAERKRRREKLKKQKKKDEAREKAELEWTGGGGKESGDKENAVKDERGANWNDDPSGEKLLLSVQKDFLSEATTSWCSMLIARPSLCTGDTLAVLAEVYLRRGKYVQAVRALSVGLHKEPNHPDLQVELVKFICRVLKAPPSAKKTKLPNLNSTILSVIKDEISKILVVISSSASELNPVEVAAELLEKAVQFRSVPHILAALKSAAVVGASTATAALQSLAGKILGDASLLSDGRGASVENAVKLWKVSNSCFHRQRGILFLNDCCIGNSICKRISRLNLSWRCLLQM